MAVVDENINSKNLYLKTDSKLKEKHLTDKEETLLKFVCDNSELFDDMLFEEGSITYPYICAQIDNEDNGNWVDNDMFFLPAEIANFSYEFFDFHVGELEGHDLGRFDARDQSLSIDPNHLYDEPTILHEMIHLHEFVLDCLPAVYRDIYILCLYKALKNKIIDLDERIESHGCILNEQYIQKKGGLHDVLFLLKSYDLDLRKGYELGAVLGDVYAIN